jgi:hypothetical protein
MSFYEKNVTLKVAEFQFRLHLLTEFNNFEREVIRSLNQPKSI